MPLSLPLPPFYPIVPNHGPGHRPKTSGRSHLPACLGGFIVDPGSLFGGAGICSNRQRILEERGSRRPGTDPFREQGRQGLARGQDRRMAQAVLLGIRHSPERFAVSGPGRIPRSHFGRSFRSPGTLGPATPGSHFTGGCRPAVSAVPSTRTVLLLQRQHICRHHSRCHPRAWPASGSVLRGEESGRTYRRRCFHG